MQNCKPHKIQKLSHSKVEANNQKSKDIGGLILLLKQKVEIKVCKGEPKCENAMTSVGGWKYVTSLRVTVMICS